MSMEYIRKTYGVPAKRGMRVIYTEGSRKRYGTIVGSQGHLLRIRLDTCKWVEVFHPTWELRYITKPPKARNHNEKA